MCKLGTYEWLVKHMLRFDGGPARALKVNEVAAVSCRAPFRGEFAKLCAHLGSVLSGFEL